VSDVDRVIKEAFPHDAFEQLVAATLWDRGHTNIVLVKRAMAEVLDYDSFGKIVDEVEDVLLG
jgi:hypothetical protein